MSHSRKKLALVLLIAFTVRLAAGWAWQSRLEGRFGMGDSDSYWSLGMTIAQGKPYEYGDMPYRIFRTPGYPILLAPIAWCLGDTQNAIMLARAEAALLGTLAIAGVWWLARLLFDERAALLAAILATFYPEAVVLSTLILSEAPFCPLMLLQLILWTLAWQARTRFSRGFLGFCGGLAAGAATLMRPSWLLFTPMAATVGMVAALVAKNQLGNGSSPQTASRRETFFRHLLVSSCMMAGLVAAMAPWWLRNAQVTGRFVATTLQTGASLYDGLGPQADGSSNLDFVHRFAAEQRQAGNSGEGSPEEQLERRIRTESLAWAKENPGKVLRLAGVKFLRIWNCWPNEARFASWPIRLVVFFTYTPLAIFAIIGVWRTIGRGWPYFLCWLPAVYLTLLHVVFVSSIRYRGPAMLALLALAAGTVMEMWKQKTRDGGRRTETFATRESTSNL